MPKAETYRSSSCNYENNLVVNWSFNFHFLQMVINNDSELEIEQMMKGSTAKGCRTK